MNSVVYGLGIILVLLSLGTACSDSFKELVIAESTDNDVLTSTGAEDERCETFVDRAEVQRIPADIVLVVDNSLSMVEMTGMIQENLNRFARRISTFGVDAHVVLISADSTDSEGVCVAAPLGSGSCPEDSNPETNYLHVPRFISSTTSLIRIYSTYDDEDYNWSHMLREEAALHFIVISDDNSFWGKDTFINSMTRLEPPLEDFTFHAIVASEDSTEGGPCEALSWSREGVVYKKLVEATGGILGDICLQDFQPVFDELAARVGNASTSCSWKIPETPTGVEFDPEQVNVDLVHREHGSYRLGYVETSDDCPRVLQGWYYDDPGNPERIIVCSQTCEWIQGQPDAEIKIILGCETEEAQPVV